MVDRCVMMITRDGGFSVVRQSFRVRIAMHDDCNYDLVKVSVLKLHLGRTLCVSGNAELEMSV